MIPFSIRQLVNGKVTASTTLDTVEFDVTADDSLFKMPAKSALPFRPGSSGEGRTTTPGAAGVPAGARNTTRSSGR